MEFLVFLSNRYTATYLRIIIRALKENRAKSAEIYYEAHHIFPKAKSCWPEYAKCPWNIVLLTAKEHLICHLLLTKMFSKGEQQHSMTIAFRYMTTPSKRRKSRGYITIGMISFARKLASKGKSGPKFAYIAKNFGDTSGENNGMYGRKHTEESRKRMSESSKSSFTKENKEKVGAFRRGKTYEDMYGTDKANQIRQKFIASHGIKCIIDGIEYPTIKNACEALNINYVALKRRIQS